jgi:DNA-binding CsgD family transcriptional regulator
MGPVVLVVAPLSVGSSVFPELSPAAIVFMSDSGCSEHPPKYVLTEVYGLTSMEATVAMELLSGERLPAIADSLRLSVNTVRTHVKHAFSKTGTRSQAQLVSLLLKLPR